MPKYVIEWDADFSHPINIWTWDDWLKVPVEERPWKTTALVEATDELDAYTQALTDNLKEAKI